MTLLDPLGAPIEVGPGVQLITPGLAGVAQVHSAATGDMRGAEETTTSLDAALAAEGLESQLTVEIAEAQEVGDAGVVTRSTGYGEPALELRVPDAGPDWGQLVIYKDEAGVLTWNFPVDERDERDVSRGSDTRRYLIRRHVPPATGGEHRGLFGAVGKKLLKVVAFKLLDKAAGIVGPFFVGKWEQAKRPYRLRSFTPGDYNQPNAAPLQAADWERLGSGRALLMVHGTISSTHTAFGSLDGATVEALHQKYDGRIFGFDHFTLSHDPIENVRRFVEMTPDTARLQLDVVCHSRGGLVSRQLAEQAAAVSLGSRDVSVDRIVFVAVPNGGTILANTDYMSDFIDTYTNILNFVPDNGVTETFEAITAIAKQLAVGTVAGLDGLQCMVPDGPFLKALNQGPGGNARYFAISSCFEPADAGWKAWVADRLMDRIFRNAANDLVVPADGVFGANGSGRFPIASPHEFAAADGIAHTRFFAHREVQRRLLQWLA